MKLVNELIMNTQKLSMILAKELEKLQRDKIYKEQEYNKRIEELNGKINKLNNDLNIIKATKEGHALFNL